MQHTAQEITTILFIVMKLSIRTISSFIAICLYASFVQAQNYSKQVDAFEKGFETKNTDAIKEYISPELSFRAFPAAVTPQILTQVFNNLPKLRGIEIVENAPGEVLLSYDFAPPLGTRESKMMFDGDGKITAIELIDNLLKQQEEAQAAAANRVQTPTPGELGEKYTPQKIQFPSGDGLIITGNLYEVDPSGPVILLAHSGGGNKYEYADIAPKLNAQGFNALAIDQRSGGAFAGQENETFNLAQSKGLQTEFTDAEQDIEAAIDYLSEKYNKKVTLWASSYSAALSLFIIQKDTKKLNGIILFSPGDYLAGAKGTLEGKLTSIDIPFLMTSAQQEAEVISEILLKGAKLSGSQIHHRPTVEGVHGVAALWEGQAGAEEYWEQAWNILSIIYPK